VKHLPIPVKHGSNEEHKPQWAEPFYFVTTCANDKGFKYYLNHGAL